MARKLKIEINTREHGAHLGYETHDFSVDTRWFKGQASVRTFQLEEILATKLRALLQRDKGRDLFDLKQAAELLPNLGHDQVVETFQKYLVISRANAEHSVLAKLERGTALDDLRPLVPLAMAAAVTTEGAMAAAAYVLTCLAAKLPGATGELTEQRIERLGLKTYMEDAVNLCARSPSSFGR